MATIDVTRGEAHATVTITNPERKNALSIAASERLADELRPLAGGSPPGRGPDQARMVETDDFAAGVTAFFGDRDPAFTGR